jgi:hypothetical protein
MNEMLVYGAKMSFLLSVADAPGGAELLVENRLIEKLHECQFVDLSPDHSMRAKGHPCIASQIFIR